MNRSQRNLAAFGVAMGIVGGMALVATAGTNAAPQERAPQTGAATKAEQAKVGKVVKSEAEWRRILTPKQYAVLRREGTEMAGTGTLLNNHAAGIYRCAGCGLDLFHSETKFESGTGWPSFWKAIPGHVREVEDNAYGMRRVEVECMRCGGHLGHVFDDGPKPTGLRYCMNSVSLKFAAKKAQPAATPNAKAPAKKTAEAAGTSPKHP